MAQSQFSLSWSAHKSNICTGLSSLQQNGEFVDMTLAADGHHVKVHQVIMALASPYIKELISSAQCPHPIIFLNKVSYNVLSAILEYIYMGEVLVPIENLSEFIEAGKELHIKGLEDMNFSQAQSKIKVIEQQNLYTSKLKKDADEPLNEPCCYFEVDAKDGEKYMVYNATGDLQVNDDVVNETLNEQTLDSSMQAQDYDMQHNVTQDESMDNIAIQENVDSESFTKMQVTPKTERNKKSSGSDCGVMQYTVSNQGSIQLILNRFVYYLKHTRRGGMRQWRCVDYLCATRCPALVVTNDDVVVQRISAHMHPFHDKKILKKVRAGAVYSAIHEAIEEGHTKKTSKQQAASDTQHSE